MSVNGQQPEDLCNEWFCGLGWTYVQEGGLAPDGEQSTCIDYRRVALSERLLEAQAI